MKLYNYLNESRTKKLSIYEDEQFDKIVQKKCSDIVNRYKKGQDIILRGAKNNYDFAYIDPTKSTRKSAYAMNNFYTLLMDELLPSWKNMPKRSKSVIATNNLNKAMGYGMMYIVYPYNGSKIGICNEEDIWDSFGYLDLTPLEELNIFLNDVGYEFDLTHNDDKSSLIDILSALDDIKKNELDFNFYKRDYNDFVNDFISSNHKTFLSYLDEQMHPGKNRFKTCSPSNYSLRNDDNEIWIEGECLLEKYTEERYNELGR